MIAASNPIGAAHGGPCERWPEFDHARRSTYDPLVLPPILQRMTAWLCLAFAFLTGISPVQGFVLCLEPCGSIGVELATSSERCNGCDDHTETTPPSAPSMLLTHETGCECVDVPFLGSTREPQIKTKPIGLETGPWVALPPRIFSPPLILVSATVRRSRVEVPRPPESLALIRSVVLLV